MTWAAWRTRSVYVSMAAHISINTIFLAFLVTALMAS